jgi:hypothetical protein
MLVCACLLLAPVLEAAAATASCAADSIVGEAEAQFAALVGLVRRSGGFVDERLVLRTQMEGPRGIFVAEDSVISMNESLFYVPFEVAMTVESARLSALGPALGDACGRPECTWGPRLPTSTSHAIVALHLMHENYNREQSFWKPYLDMLPTRALLPMDFPPSLERILGLSASLPLGCEIAAARREADWEAAWQFVIQKHRSMFQQKTDAELKADFMWAHNTISMRSWSELLPAFPSAANLIPLADAFNHHSTKGIHIYQHKLDLGEGSHISHKRGVALHAPLELESGAEVFESYLIESTDTELSCNANLFVLFGFVVDDSAHDCYLLTVGFTPPAVPESDEVRILTAALKSTSSECTLSGGKEIVGISKALVRIRLLLALMDTGNARPVVRAGASFADEADRLLRGGPAPSAEVEVQALALLRGAMSEQLELMQQRGEELKHAVADAAVGATTEMQHAKVLYSIKSIQSVASGEGRVLLGAVKVVDNLLEEQQSQ